MELTLISGHLHMLHKTPSSEKRLVVLRVLVELCTVLSTIVKQTKTAQGHTFK